jgi:hypothetical protein
MSHITELRTAEVLAYLNDAAVTNPEALAAGEAYADHVMTVEGLPARRGLVWYEVAAAETRRLVLTARLNSAEIAEWAARNSG